VRGQLCGKVRENNICKAGLINVAYDDGTQQILSVDENVPIVQDNKLMDFDALKDGDRVKLLLNITDKATTLKKLTVEGDEHFYCKYLPGYSGIGG